MDIGTFVVSASSARIHLYRASYLGNAETTSVLVDVQPEVRHATNLRVELAGPPTAGYVGLAVNRTSSWRMDATSHASAEPREETDLMSEAAITNPQTKHSEEYYYQKIQGLHVLLESPGTLTFQGGASLKARGLPLRMISAEGDALFDTRNGPGTTPVGYEVRWIVIESREITVEISSGQQWQAASKAISLRWAGDCVLDSLGGSIQTGEGVHPIGAGMGVIRGTFESSVVPALAGERPVLQMSFRGDLDSTTYAPSASQARIATLAPGSITLALVAVTVASTAGGGTFLLLRARRRQAATRPPPPPPPLEADPAPPADLTPELCVSLAETQVQTECWPRALHWITLARQMCPTSATVRATEAFVLGELGQTEEALAAYEEASRLDPEEGEHDLNAARLALRRGHPVEVVEAFVLRALARSPHLVGEVEPDDALMEALGGRPAFRAAVVEAWSHF